MSIHEDIEFIITPPSDGIDIFYDGLPDHPIVSIAIVIGPGTISRRHGIASSNHQMAINVRHDDPAIARDVSKSITLELEANTNFVVNGNGYISIFTTSPQRLQSRGLGGDTVYTTTFNIARRDV